MNNLKNLSIILFVLLTSLGILSYYNHIEVEEKRELKKEAIERIESVSWTYFKGVVSENYQKSSYFIETIGSNIRRDILTFDIYINNPQLFIEDLNNFNKDNHNIVNIIGSNIQEQYLNNIVNDNNDSFAMTKTDGVIGDFSLNCSAYGRTRSFDEEYTMHYSPRLAKEAIERIKNQDIPNTGGGRIENPIGWSFLPPKEGIDLVNSFTWEELREVFFKHGVEGFSSYEWLYPYYIDSDKDLLGIPNVSNAGIKQDNKQIIVVSGFNIVDIINNNSNHLMAFNSFKFKRKQIEQTFRNSIILNQVITISTIILFILSFISLSLVLNRQVDQLKQQLESENE